MVSSTNWNRVKLIAHCDSLVGLGIPLSWQGGVAHGIEMLASATPKIPKHRLTPPVAPNGVEQGKVYWQS